MGPANDAKRIFAVKHLAYEARTQYCAPLLSMLIVTVSTETVVCADNESLVVMHGQDLSDVALMQWQVLELPLKFLVAGIDSDGPINCLECTFVLGMRLEFGNRAGHWLHPICRCAQHGRGENWRLADGPDAETKSISLA